MRTSFASKLVIAATLLVGASTAVQAQDVCTAASFTGAFGYKLQGSVYDSRGYIYVLAAAGRMVSDGAGAITGADTMSYDGNPVKRKYTGSYTVNVDCTGSLVINADDSSIMNADFVIVNDGKEVSLIQTDNNFVLSGDLKLQKTPAQTPAPAPVPPTPATPAQ